MKWSRKAVAAGVIGNFIELYDATLYTLLAPVFAPQFFPAGTTATALFYTYGVLAGVGIVVRPIATVLLSPLGDRLGRRRLLSLTLFIMGGGVLVVALTPNYQAIGAFAPVLLILGRVAQNLGATLTATLVTAIFPPDGSRRGAGDCRSCSRPACACMACTCAAGCRRARCSLSSRSNIRSTGLRCAAR